MEEKKNLKEWKLDFEITIMISMDLILLFLLDKLIQ